MTIASTRPMPQSRQSLQRLFAPRTIAVIGASPAPEKAGYQALRSLARFPGTLVPINLKATEILGHRTYPSLAAVGFPVDLAILAIPAGACPAALDSLAAAGGGAGLIISGGFGEAGPAGVLLQNALAATCAQTGIRLLGPNTSGFINPITGCAASFAPGVEALQNGTIAIVAQSGGVNLTLAFQLHALGYGLSLAVGLGNMVDIDAADVIDYLATDAATKVIGLHLEGVSYGRKLVQALARVTPHKPVVALAVGRADVGEFAASHTGNLIGSHALKVAALRQAGAVVVATTDDLVDACALFSHARIPAKANPGVAIVTGQAGPGLIIADQLKVDGVDLPTLTAATIATLDTLLPPLTFYKNPVDTGRPGPSFAAVMATVAQDPAIDAIACFTLNEPAAVDPVAVLGDLAVRFNKPIALGTMGTMQAIVPTITALSQRGIATFTSPDRLARAISALVADARAAAHAQASVDPARGPLHSRAPLASDLDEDQAKSLLGEYGIASPPRLVCASIAQVRAALVQLGAPIVAKILSTEVTHKTEVGGVIVNIRTASDLDAALAKLDRIALNGARRYLIESMAPAGLELIIGAVRDASFGPIVAVGLGGVTAEALEDVAMCLAPLSRADALAMLSQLKAHALLDGWRGSPKLDRDALADAIVAVGELMLDQADIVEIDLNPVRTYPTGLLALDALIIRAPRSHTA